MGVLRSRTGCMAAVILAMCLSMASEVEAYPWFQQKLPNGANVPGVEAIGHKGADGGPNNGFGQDFIKAKFKWTKKFCEKDSDGDGQTNGQELGDPCCEFEVRTNEKMRWTDGVSHPGNPKRMADPALWEGIICGADEKEFTAGAPALHASVMLSAVALTVMVIYVVVMRGRRSHGLPIIGQQRKGTK